MGFSIGNSSYPMSDFAESDREVANPAHQILLDLLFYNIFLECNAAYQDVFDTDGYVLVDAIPFNISQNFVELQERINYPCINLWRVDSKVDEFAINVQQNTTTWNGIYLYGALDLDNQIKAIGFNNAITSCITMTLDRMAGETYKSGKFQAFELGISFIKNLKFNTEGVSFKLDDNSKSMIKLSAVSFSFDTVELVEYFADTEYPLTEINLATNIYETGTYPVDGYATVSTSNISVTETIGNVTINKTAGRCILAASSSSITVTNSYVTANSIIIITIATNDTTAKSAIVVPTTGSFEIISNAAATANTNINFLVINTV
jgi:hypothetical protein